MIFEPKQSRRSKFSARNIQSEAPIELYMPLTVSKNSCILLAFTKHNGHCPQADELAATHSKLTKLVMSTRLILLHGTADAKGVCKL